MLISLEKIKDYIVSAMLIFTLSWVIFALSFQVYFVILEISGNQEEMNRITSELTVRIDGNYVDNPKNIFYKGK
jgi:hypothetical protein